LKYYGNLGKWIKQGPYFEPQEPDHANYGSCDPAVDTDGLSKITYLVAIKEWRKEKARIKRDVSQQNWDDVEKQNDAQNCGSSLKKLRRLAQLVKLHP
jgi:hypothetical protein